ncbi:hypothetical protein K493DRAFT_318933 [Basidiobolus meristosporus CBS 931.73]|uniref:Uncharacterized protein n=1 Tax=Basidiobolus meristosporus CBS 931.73 TaxID=1314790 RepID=A0A1Y1XTS2_9FUNG|nr:hypothetical protein K493DRAFT_318933 [Basidiobolus meristosporus CBS 931.73]|eukprot:ORX89140.1 hypothetical protein K493DRAFT_318933 [Basidiobolus meristosporus CBS 931.73]
MKSFAAIVLGAIAFSQLAYALPQDADAGAGVVEAPAVEAKDSVRVPGFLRSIHDYLRENISASGEGSLGGVGQAGYKSRFIPGLAGGLKGNFGATGNGKIDREGIRGDGDIGGSGSGGIGVGKGYGFEKTDYE